ncbi:hypothetical protein [Leifsonia sp. SIMBA_070]|uniref:hypothetical protein n=1 Tax=Leifsonia sp. SIMBA_070 TaxID=3085810 RepID=UPI0039782F08
MTSSTRFRFGALAAAATVIAGGFFAAAPANAATGTLTVASTDIIAGAWAELDVTGAGFTAGAAVTLTLTNDVTGDSESYDVANPVDDNGDFEETILPQLADPVLDETLTLTATSDLDDESTPVTLTVVDPTPPVDEMDPPVDETDPPVDETDPPVDETDPPVDETNPPVDELEDKGITSNVSTITTADLVNPDKGIQIHAAGYTPGETLTIVVDYAGQKLPVVFSVPTADEAGTYDFAFYLAGGVATAGKLTVTVTGDTSTVSNSIDIDVTGDDTVADDNVDPGAGQGEDFVPAPDADPSTETAGTSSVLPIVAG